METIDMTVFQGGGQPVTQFLSELEAKESRKKDLRYPK